MKLHVPIAGAIALLAYGFAAPPAIGADARAKEHGALVPDALVARVLERNPGLSAMRSAAAAAQARIYPAGALDDPMLSFQLPPETISSEIGVKENVQLSQALPWPGTLRLRRQAAEALGQSAAQRVEDFRLRLTAEARAAYAQWAYVHRAIAINDQNQALLQRLTAVAETAYASGKAPQQDVLQAQVESVRLQNQAFELKRRRREIQAAINGLLNLDPGTPVPVPAGLPSGPTLPTFERLQDAALDRYPQLKALDAELAAGRDQVALARKQYYPNFKLNAGYNSLWENPQLRPIVGVAINLPFDFKKRNAGLDEANAQLHQTQFQRLDIRAQLLSDLQQAYAGADQERQTVELDDRRLLPLSRLNFEAAKSDYRAGNGSFLNLITAEQRYLLAELEQASAQADLFTALAKLDYQTGGALFARAPAAAPEPQP